MIDRVGESVIPAITKTGVTSEIRISEAEQKPADESADQGIPLPKEELQKFADQVNTFLQPTQTHVQFEYHDELQE